MPRHVARGNAKRARIRSHVEHVFAAQKCRFALLIRTVGKARHREARARQPRLQLHPLLVAGDPAGSLNTVIAFPSGGDHAPGGRMAARHRTGSRPKTPAFDLSDAASASEQRVLRGVRVTRRLRGLDPRPGRRDRCPGRVATAGVRCGTAPGA